MTVFRLPSPDELRTTAERLGMSPDDAYLRSALAAMAPIAATYRVLDELGDGLPEPTGPRPTTRPLPQANPHNAWVVRTALKTRADGPLSGRRIALKDNICLAGVPMTNGGALPAAYVPDVDATVVTRILAAGGEIAGKTACEWGCVSGGSHTGSGSPVHNPHRRGYSAGGSSSGSAVVVAAGDVDMALGSDQGGSIRIPASYCGVHGLKPTFGLVPYSGMATLEASIDHCGPITVTASDNALLLDVIAGPDGLDERQRQIPTSSYANALEVGVQGLRIGILKEGFAATNSDPRVDAKVLAAGQRFMALGASVEEVSIPWHLHGAAVWSPITHEGGFISMWASHGLGIGVPGLGVPSLARACAAWRDRPDEQADTVRVMMLFGQASLDRYQGAYYAKANNLRRALRAAYDTVLAQLDLLLMPTMPTTAPPLPDADDDLWVRTGASWPMAANLCPFNVTGHPALSAPCGMVDGLPVGMMLVAGHGDEASIYRAAGAFEANYEWKRL